ncbi:MAG TPA: hypothetical protein VF494_08905 [Candidatus Limnocylindrales bacterium]
MTVSEFTFLALGLVLGLASGIALVEIIRARPPARGEVRVTVAQDAIPRRRPATLSDDAFVAVGPEPARGGPADRREIDLPLIPAGVDRRTHVPSGGPLPGSGGPPGVAVPVVPEPGPVFRIQALDPTRPSGPRAALVGFTVTRGEDPVLAELRASIVEAAAQADPASATIRRQTAVAVLEPERPAVAAPPDAPAPPRAGSSPRATERCAEERRIAEERCELATRARSRAEEAANALRLAQRSYDSHESAAGEAAARGDPRAVRAAKEEAQRVFRAATRAATNAEAVEGAARDWLREINRINAEAREAVAATARERAAAADIGATLERLGLDADAARIGADTAEAACVAARAALAECDEREAIDPGAYLLPPLPPMPPMPSPEAARPDADEMLGIAIEAGAMPRIFRLLHGDRAVMTTLVAALAAGDPAQAPRWEELVTRLVDAILADAIESSALEFPPDHPFWGPFSQGQAREIVQALASLGYRFDGRGGWLDDRVPSQRDLSLALGYAGLDPMRVRRWPDEAASRVLFSEVRVAADEYLAVNAGDLTLGEMVAMLGRRADGLAELWNQWGTVRPLLLQDA